MARWIEINLPKGVQGREGVAIRMSIEPGLKFLDSGRSRRHAVDDELDLLADPAPHDRVVPVEAHGNAFAIENLLADPVVDETLEFLGGWRPSPGTLELLLQPLDLGARDHDLVGSSRESSLQPAVQQEQSRAQEQEMEQRLAEQTLHLVVLSRPGS